MDVKVNGSPETAVFAPGDGGQFLAVLPGLNMIIVVTGGNYDRDPSTTCWTLVENEILPALTDDSLSD
jgi:hypothetical protein